jgi:riboflavin synthase
LRAHRRNMHRKHGSADRNGHSIQKVTPRNRAVHSQFAIALIATHGVCLEYASILHNFSKVCRLPPIGRFCSCARIVYLVNDKNIMFTGIIEHLGAIASLSFAKGGGRITIHAPSLAASISVSGSIAVNGCCLTVVECNKESFSADLSAETLEKTSFRKLKPDTLVNLEQPLTAGKEFGGHFVLGHVDGTGRVVSIEPEGEGWRYSVKVPEELAKYVVPKGSITIDGVSLTVANWHAGVAAISVIPYTYKHTNIRDRKTGDVVNLEGDVIGKYIERHLDSREPITTRSRLTIDGLKAQGF